MKIPNAIPTGEIERQFDLDNYNDTVFFHLKDTTHEFTMCLRDILKCLEQAEQNGLVPELPKKWWDSISTIYTDFTAYNEPVEDDDD